MNTIKQPKSLLQYPTPESLQLVEKAIRDHSGEFKKAGIWKMLRGKVPYQAFCIIFAYFEENRRIARDRYGTVGWTWNPKRTAYYASRPDLAWNP